MIKQFSILTTNNVLPHMYSCALIIDTLSKAAGTRQWLAGLHIRMRYYVECMYYIYITGILLYTLKTSSSNFESKAMVCS